MADNIAKASAYIASATLAPIQAGLYSRAQVLEEVGDRGKYLGEAGEEGAATVGGTLVSVLANLTGINRTDVANSLEFASRVAAKEVGDDDHTAAYWRAFSASILQIGWLKQADQWSSDFINGQTSGAENFSDYVIENVRNDPLYSDAEKSVVIRAMESLRSQAEKRAFFRRFTAGGSKGSFGVNAATVTNGALAMRFSAFAFNCNAVVDDYLIFSIKNITADVQKNNVDVAANQRTIDAVRKQIEEKLDQAAGDYIDSVDI
ncbi:32 kDa-cell wall symbiosis regulated acidic polypeptide [Pisolithus marmoratus]|nr:32 kDa-cell wall symbiosis regulated acidic polypeptide [Pisolithus marmoratus]